MSMDGGLLRTRMAQWKAFEKWHETEDPARIVPPEVALRWADEMREFIRKYNGGQPEALVSTDGVRIMHERLAKLPPSPSERE